MDWDGIEWVLPLYELSMLVVPVYAFVMLRRRGGQGMLSKGRALRRYAGLVIAPVIIYAIFFLLLIGFEEVTHIGVISEELGRSFFFVTGLGLIIWLVACAVFGIALLFASQR